jgi:hypothetical protein
MILKEFTVAKLKIFVICLEVLRRLNEGQLVSGPTGCITKKATTNFN